MYLTAAHITLYQVTSGPSAEESTFTARLTEQLSVPLWQLTMYVRTQSQIQGRSQSVYGQTSAVLSELSRKPDADWFTYGKVCTVFAYR